jgi:uncharacterized membrane protein HdeD (DUF308 family)
MPTPHSTRREGSAGASASQVPETGQTAAGQVPGENAGQYSSGTQGAPVPQQSGMAWGEPQGSRTGLTQDARDAAAFGNAAWPAFLAAGLGCLAIGIILLVWPNETLKIVSILVGISLIVAGLLRLVHGFTDHDTTGGRRAGNIVIGLLAMVVGLYCLKHHNITLFTIAFLVGAFWVIHGLADIGAALFGGSAAGPGSRRALVAVIGLFSLAAGLLLMFWPALTLVVLWRLLGIWLIVYGVMTMLLALMLRSGASKAARSGADTGSLASA